MSDKKRIIFLSIGIFFFGLLIISGTYAALTFDAEITNGNYVGSTTCFYINYNITNDDGSTNLTGTLFPSANPTGGLVGNVTMGMDSSCKVNGVGNIYLKANDISSIFTQTVKGHCEDSRTLKTLTEYTTSSSCSAQSNAVWVTNGTALKYAVYTDVSANPVSVGYVTGNVSLYSNFDLTTTPVKYYVYVWLDGELSDNSYASLPFNGYIHADAVQDRGYKEIILNGAYPELETGMIPVTISDTGVVKTADLTTKWYSYENKQWANAVLVNNASRSTYINQDGKINANLTIPEDNILAYYVWIPRYKYTFPKANGSPELISIIFENKNTAKSIPTTGKASGTNYYTHPAFTFGNNELNGIWVGKFETGHSTLKSDSDADNNNLACTTENCENADGLIIKPNVTSLRRNSLSNFFYASRSMSRTNNPFGLDASTSNTHMIKNSEWGAIAYLSHSQYGKGNVEITININSSYTTGVGDGTTYFSPATGTYTHPQSTTGNITGVFDISGGAWEYVMGNYNNTIGSSNFSTLPDSKYYDVYLSSQFNGNYSTNIDKCDLATCGGHALYETAGWYSDYALFVYADNPWFPRGGVNFNGSNAGAFNSTYSAGGASSSGGFRTAVIKGA